MSEPLDPPCGIATVGAMCPGCERLIMVHSVCPRSGMKPDGTAAPVVDLTRFGLNQNVVTRGVLQKFAGNDTSGEPLETIEIHEGHVVSHIVHRKEE